MVTNLLRQAAARVGHQYGIKPADISARALRASGAMALLCAGVDRTISQLMGRWKTDEMLKYLHIQCPSLVRDLAPRMLAAGDYSFTPGSEQHTLVHTEQPSQLYLDTEGATV